MNSRDNSDSLTARLDPRDDVLDISSDLALVRDAGGRLMFMQLCGSYWHDDVIGNDEHSTMQHLAGKKFVEDFDGLARLWRRAVAESPNRKEHHTDAWIDGEIERARITSERSKLYRDIVDARFGDLPPHAIVRLRELPTSSEVDELARKRGRPDLVIGER